MGYMGKHDLRANSGTIRNYFTKYVIQLPKNTPFHSLRGEFCYIYLHRNLPSWISMYRSAAHFELPFGQ
jgi:hypothetical protein